MSYLLRNRQIACVCDENIWASIIDENADGGISTSGGARR